MKLLTMFPMGTQLYLAYEEGKCYTLAREGDVSSGALYWQELPDMPHYREGESQYVPPLQWRLGQCRGCMFWQLNADSIPDPRADPIPAQRAHGRCVNEHGNPSGGHGRNDVEEDESCHLWHARLTHGE
jgi:hypothetical protein